MNSNVFDTDGGDMNGAIPFAPPAPGTQIFQEITNTESLTIPSQGKVSFQTRWPKAVKIVEFTPSPGFMVESILIGSLLFNKYREVEGRRVEANTIVTVNIVNPQLAPGACKGTWTTEDAPLGLAVTDMEPLPQIPGVPEVYNQAAPQGQVQNVMPAIHGPHPNAAPTYAPAMVQSYSQVGTGGQQFIHYGGIPQAGSSGVPGMPARPQSVGPDEIAVMFTAERAQKVAFVLKGGIMMPQEVPAIAHVIEQAMMRPGMMASAGVNETVFVITRTQAQRILGMLKGTDWQELQGLVLKFEGKA